MKMLITYSSLTGNTKKLAEGIYAHFKDHADICAVDAVGALDDYDVILHGYWVNRGGPDDASKAFLESLRNKRVGIFATLGAYPDSEHAGKSLDSGEACLDASNTLIGRFICQGAVSKSVQERMYTFPEDHPHYPDAKRIQRWKDASTHPDDIDIRRAIQVFAHAL